MSDGPVMLSATETLKTPPLRLGRITETIVLPRSIEVKKILAVAVGLILAFPFFVILGIVFKHNFTLFLILESAGAATGLLLVSWSPLKGESFSKWLGLASSSRTSKKVYINGKEVRAYIGIAPLQNGACGSVRIVGAAVTVVPNNFDYRGVPVKKSVQPPSSQSV